MHPRTVIGQLSGVAQAEEYLPHEIPCCTIVPHTDLTELKTEKNLSSVEKKKVRVFF